MRSVFASRVNQSRQRVWVDAANILDRSYKRDKDGKFSSGSGGGGEGPRQSLADATTTGEISAVLAREATALQGHTVTADLSGLPPAVAREYGEGLLRGMEAYPGTRLAKVETYGPGGVKAGDPYGREVSVATVGVTVHGRVRNADGTPVNEDSIHFNTSAPTQMGEQQFRDALRRNGDTGQTIAHNPMSIAIHEFGHVVAAERDGEARVNRLALDEAHARGEDTIAYVGRSVSAYAAASRRELAAEAFADVLVNGSGASRLSRDAVGVLADEYTTRQASK